MGSAEHKFLKGSGVKRTGFRGQNKRFRGGKNMLRGQENKEGVKKYVQGLKNMLPINIWNLSSSLEAGIRFHISVSTVAIISIKYLSQTELHQLEIYKI